MSTFIPNDKFKRDYDKLFKAEPEQANLLLLMCELANEKGQVKATNSELITLFNIRFNHPKEYAFGLE